MLTLTRTLTRTTTTTRPFTTNDTNKTTPQKIIPPVSRPQHASPTNKTTPKASHPVSRPQHASPTNKTIPKTSHPVSRPQNASSPRRRQGPLTPHNTHHHYYKAPLDTCPPSSTTSTRRRTNTAIRIRMGGLLRHRSLFVSRLLAFSPGGTGGSIDRPRKNFGPNLRGVTCPRTVSAWPQAIRLPPTSHRIHVSSSSSIIRAPVTILILRFSPSTLPPSMSSRPCRPSLVNPPRVVSSSE